MKKSSLLLSALLTLCSGCISVEYSGEKLAQKAVSAKLAVFSDSAAVKKNYSVLGVATVSGNYRDVSRDRMIGKLRDEARKCGADAILIVEQQVVPENDNASDPVFMTAFDYDDTSQSWSQLYRDVDRNFVNPDRNRSQTTAGSVNNFKRVIRAEFLRFK